MYDARLGKFLSVDPVSRTFPFYSPYQFAGNMLQVHNNTGERFLVMSSQAYNALTNEQVLQIETYNKIIHSDITTIETNGGGSARCMMAEVFLPVK